MFLFYSALTNTNLNLRFVKLSTLIFTKTFTAFEVVLILYLKQELSWLILQIINFICNLYIKLSSLPVPVCVPARRNQMMSCMEVCPFAC